MSIIDIIIALYLSMTGQQLTHDQAKDVAQAAPTTVWIIDVIDDTWYPISVGK